MHADVGVAAPRDLAPDRVPEQSRARLLLLIVIAFSLLTGWNVGRESLLLWIPVVLAILAVYTTIRPDLLFVGWLAVAPYIQESARATPTGWVLTNVFYVLPVGVLLIRMLRSNKLAGNITWYDAFPLLYICLIILSKGVVDALELRDPGFYTELLHAGVFIGPPLYYLCAFGPLDRLSPRHFSAALLTTCSVSGALGIYEHFTHWNLWGAPEIRDSPGDPLRIVGTLSNVHVLGAFFGSGIVMATAILCFNGPPLLRRLSIVTLTLTLPALFFTYTRGGILATVVVTVVLVATRPRLRVLAAVLALLVSFVVWFSWGQISSNQLYAHRFANVGNVQGREAQNQAALELASERPILGWGYGRYNEVKNSKMPYAGPLSASVYKYTSHNTYLTILVELGIVGLVVAFLPWAIVVGSVIRRFASMPYPTWYTVSLIAVVGVVVLTAQTTDMRFFSFVPALAWCCVGLLRRGLWARATPA
jgi:O-antigen ligase/polysaccharide polymerase Wzy-like membrane protein